MCSLILLIRLVVGIVLRRLLLKRISLRSLCRILSGLLLSMLRDNVIRKVRIRFRSSIWFRLIVLRLSSRRLIGSVRLWLMTTY